ncbi:hypothetical protein F8388_017622 [Cannabis sativa]|uniref:Transferase n=2 Tax=Cannabis sativa TaxID=3483 RepID=A0A7J6EQJ9_CANSA|nr:hypothetical protein F8388_017622 [Cannabis sativa]
MQKTREEMALKMKACYMVKPAEPTWKGCKCLSEWDQTGTITHVPTIYFYRPPQDWVKLGDKIAATLKQSLSRALVPFYPLAGRLRRLPSGNRLELNCNAEGVEFVEAECNLKLDELGDLSCSSEHNYHDLHLTPLVDYTRPIHELPLLLAQLTRFACGGVSLGLTISHAVVDGPSALHFISEWASLSRGEPIKTMPFLDREFLIREVDDGDVSDGELSCLDHFPLLIEKSDNLEEKKKEVTPAFLKVTKEQLEKLKRLANKGRVSETRPYSRYEMLAAHIWRCACKARKHSSPEQPTALAICVDVRSRIEPPLPSAYFGNASFDVKALSSSGELLSNPLGFAAGKIRETVEKVTNEYIWSNLKYLKNQKDLRLFQDLHGEESSSTTADDNKELFYGNPNLGVVSWLTLPLYGLDFGWGKEVAMRLETYDTDFDGDFVLLQNPNGDDEDGSLIVSVRLQVLHMDSFKKHFYADII